MRNDAEYGELIQSMHMDLSRCDETWRARAYEMARARLHRPDEFLDWVKTSNHWSFIMAEVMTTVNALRRPLDLAYDLLVAILGELREERTVFSGSAVPAS